MSARRVHPGVGVLFNPALIDFVEQHPESFDHLAVIPDRCWVDPGPGHAAEGGRFQVLPAPLAVLERVVDNCPVTLHSIGLSICSATVFDSPYVDNLAVWCRRWQARWASEHLSFSRFGSDHEANAALALPIAYDEEMLDLLVPRIDAVQQKLGLPFLLENNVAYVNIPEQGMSEPEFLNRLCARTSCHLLLDLHNLYTNAVNHHFDPVGFIDALDLSRVLEVHVAGGEPMMGFHTDSHTGPVLEPVWQLLEAVASRESALRAVTFEFHESSWPMLRSEGVLAQLARARAVLDQAESRALDQAAAQGDQPRRPQVGSRLGALAPASSVPAAAHAFPFGPTPPRAPEVARIAFPQAGAGGASPSP